MPSPSSFDPTRDYDQEAKDARIDGANDSYCNIRDATREIEIARYTPDLPEVILARWKAEDWDDRTMTASTYTYTDMETGDSVDLTDSEAEMYSWGTCHDDLTGGSQVGWLRP